MTEKNKSKNNVIQIVKRISVGNRSNTFKIDRKIVDRIFQNVQPIRPN